MSPSWNSAGSRRRPLAPEPGVRRPHEGCLPRQTGGTRTRQANGPGSAGKPDEVRDELRAGDERRSEVPPPVPDAPAARKDDLVAQGEPLVHVVGDERIVPSAAWISASSLA